VFLLSRGCDLRLVDNQGQSALDLYDFLYNNLSNEIKEQRRQILRDAFAEGPHISQVCSRLAVANQVNHSIAPSTSLTTTIPTLPPPPPLDSAPQVRRRNWLRRLPFLHFGAGCGFQPLAARLALELAANPPLPPDAAIPAEPNETPEQERALLRQGVFGNEGIFKLITSYI
jgi:hypothetical protein